MGNRTKEEITNEYTLWTINAKGEDIDLAKELDEMESNEEIISDAFYRDLSFGTGGLRGVIGAGTNRMNIYTVRRASQGLSNYLKVSSGTEASSSAGTGASVVIARDSRIKSGLFAKAAAGVFAANGIKVYFFNDIAPTPLLSFAVRELHASAGIVITASHNPKEYNGYKVYGSDGCQITTQVAKDIQDQIQTVDTFEVEYVAASSAFASGMLESVDNRIYEDYLSAVRSQSCLYDADIDKNVSIVYTPLNGTGFKPVTDVLKSSGYSNITVVEAQREPDGNFPACPKPNPEERSAMEEGLRICREVGADLLIATDPDADRCGIAVRVSSGSGESGESGKSGESGESGGSGESGESGRAGLDGASGVGAEAAGRVEADYVLLSANETGVLLLDYICSQRVKHHAMPEKPVFMKTIVTTPLAEKIAENYGCQTINTLTGFKFIGEKIGELEAVGRAEDFIFAFEESYGYLTGSYVRDKDGVLAAYLICEMFCYYKTRDVSLLDKLQQIYDQYGYCLNTLHNFEFPGSSGMDQMKGLMEGLRNTPLSKLDEQKVDKVTDYSSGIADLPPSNVLKFRTQDYSLIVRPSGTEPKLKAYISVTAEDRSTAEAVEGRINSDLEKRVESFY